MPISRFEVYGMTSAAVYAPNHYPIIFLHKTNETDQIQTFYAHQTTLPYESLLFQIQIFEQPLHLTDSSRDPKSHEGVP